MSVTIQIVIENGQVDSDLRTDRTTSAEMLLAADVLTTFQKNILRLVMKNQFDITVQDEKTEFIKKPIQPPKPKGK